MIEKSDDTKRGRYLLHDLEELTMNGDAYVTSDQLYRFSRRRHKSLTYDRFCEDRAFLLQKGLLRLEGTRLYLRNTWNYESAAAESLAYILNNNDLGEAPVPWVLTDMGIPLADEQWDAIRLALRYRLSIILGGAGSGKTTLVHTLAAHCLLQDRGVVLCAPTGKAACNLTERTGLRACTVHSALGKEPGNEYFPLKIKWAFTDLVVVDEASMLTLEMLAGLLSVVNPACHVVLVGDPNQLLSVGPGNVLPDLLALGVPHIRLNSFHRQTDANSALAYNVREFGACRSIDDLRFDKSFRFVPLLDDEAIRNCVCQGGIALYKLGADVQVLSPFNRSGLLSGDALNAIFQAHLNPATAENAIEGSLLRTGDRVIIQQNDWGQRVCNGDIGRYYQRRTEDNALLYSVACSRGRVAVWSGRNEDVLAQVRLAYTITVHKSQGSEYDTVVLPVSKAFSPMLQRNLLYTAISRAKKHVVIVGDPDALNMALQREAPPRRSMLVTKTHACQEQVMRRTNVWTTLCLAGN